MKNLLRLTLTALCLLGISAYASTPAGPETARLLPPSNPASVGVQLGDVLRRSFIVEVAEPYQISRASLPAKGLRRDGIELNDISITTVSKGQHTRYRVDLVYQVFAHTDTPSVMQLPAEQLALTGGPQALTVNLPAWRFWFAPLANGRVDNAKRLMLPQQATPRLDSQHHLHTAWGWAALALLALLGLVYVNAERRWLPFMGGAFAQAHRQLRRLEAKAATDNSEQQQCSEQSLLVLHHAFNQVYGANVFASDVDTFVARHPQFARLKGEIQAFFTRSGHALFGGKMEGTELRDYLLGLSRQLRDCERRVG
ncbi:MAG TPA: nonribosomal peptide synthetase MxaA [Methylophilaceae bacterium]|nr:nonribosomal peptide synthetase MxaA [Methylophilaceae bacterium]